MHQIALTFITLAAVVAALLLLRARWPGLSHRVRARFVATALAAVVLFGSAWAIHWTTTSDRANCIVLWAATSGYLLLLTVHSLSRPRWLTSVSAIILALPILSSSIFLPLGKIFHPEPRSIVPLGGNLYASRQPFTELGTPSSGIDLEIFVRPRFLPLQHVRLGGRFYRLQCNVDDLQLHLQPDHRSVFVLCPSWPGSPANDSGHILPLHR